ncbi:hypothetical protein Q765_08695 [Flavobacterium rivuli WB 3.3-2 = DSM 21788]|uniref:Uncharacterized protein n=1 Tax=Flavobacterium rivuli WB 3.3-2 = DSM 21788 TaxID=1121895 RepID=A0A0A2MEJ4_9FLAO|nr:hypothetical protein [Flavobacterium rivuli]KGO86700.1 hypothetical protein Q765_08695 [Flavobacterium rivuli WB 3.3-2 = DSM 21788]
MISIKKIVLTIALILGLIVVVILVFNFKKTNEYYSVKTIDAEVVQIVGDSVEGLTIQNYNENQKGRMGIILKFKKEFKAGKRSEKMLLDGREPGRSGTMDAITQFSINFTQNGIVYKIKDSLLAKDILYKSSGGGDEDNFYKNNISLGKFINDININAEYTKGFSFVDTKLYFWLTPKMDSIVRSGQGKFTLNFESDILKVHKVIDSK